MKSRHPPTSPTPLAGSASYGPKPGRAESVPPADSGPDRSEGIPGVVARHLGVVLNGGRGGRTAPPERQIMTTTTTPETDVTIGALRNGKLTAKTLGGGYIAHVDRVEDLPSLAASVRRLREVWSGEGAYGAACIQRWLDLVDIHPLGSTALRIAASEWGVRAEPTDRVTTIALGDLRGDGSRIPADRFEAIADKIARKAEAYGGTVYAVTYGEGIGSDGDNLGEAERSAVILVGNVENETALRLYVARALRASGMTSAAYSTDADHEPVFDTPTGERRVDVEIEIPARTVTGRPLVGEKARHAQTQLAEVLTAMGALDVVGLRFREIDDSILVTGRASRAEVVAKLNHLGFVIGCHAGSLGVSHATLRVDGVADTVEPR